MMNWRSLIITCSAALLGALAAWLFLGLTVGAGAGQFAVRLTLPTSAGEIGLPAVQGPADASRPLIVIDACHGGHDPGASGRLGEKEKAVTLALARAVRDALLKQGRVRVALTRDSDRFLVLEERAGIARRLGADAFVSIHADASEAEGASGATIYTLSDRGSDAVADRLAARENRADTINGVALGDKSDVVSSILVDLARREMRTRSQRFSALVLREGKEALRFHADPQREAAFVVLKTLDLPSLLIEAGYISNPNDARALTDPAWRADFGKSIAAAITIYLAQQEAPGIAP
jgi:N-acetylmuramoyl-L-alanine amidase